ncbi:MAG: 3-oxoacyl-[acyl-carrier-protein] synthase [Polaromonas sp.]|nr:3-oxoacyl-[acyl-carrier-protein] synthase [Polaromonas sp.]
MRVAVTGLGVVSPLGHSAADAFAAARAGRSAIRKLNLASMGRLAAPVAATVEGFAEMQHIDPPRLRMLDRCSQFALAASSQAMADAQPGLTEPERGRAGVFIGTGMGGISSIDEGYRTLYGEKSDRIKPFTILMGMHNAPAAWIGIEHGLSGPNLTFSTACSSSAVAIGEAWLRLSRGELDLAIAGGTEAPLALGSMKAWEALRTVATVDEGDPASSCKPFAKNRSGMVLGEGAAMLVLEPWERAAARGARIHGEVIGYGLFTDTGHVTRPGVEGQAAAMRAALLSARIDASQIDAINAHGTGTLANDSVETAAVKAVFGSRASSIPISATKALHGHLLGATSALEAVLSILSMRHSVALPTMHLQQADPLCDLDYVANAAREGVLIRTLLSSSFAFGGTNAVLVFQAAG